MMDADTVMEPMLSLATFGRLETPTEQLGEKRVNLKKYHYKYNMKYSILTIGNMRLKRGKNMCGIANYVMGPCFMTNA